MADGSYIEPRFATASTEIAFDMPLAHSRVPSMGSTATSQAAPVPSPTSSPLNSIGALSFSPSPMTTTPRIDTELIIIRIALTAAPSAPFLSPRPTHLAAAIDAASVTRASSSARLRSGACRSGSCSCCSAVMASVVLASLVPILCWALVNWAIVNRVLHICVATLGCLLAAAIIVVAVPVPHAAEPVTVRYRSALGKLIRLPPDPAVPPGRAPRIRAAGDLRPGRGRRKRRGHGHLAARVHDPGWCAGPARRDQRQRPRVHQADDQQRNGAADGTAGRAGLEPQLDSVPGSALDVLHQRGRADGRRHRQRDLGPAAPRS